jgi:hypothetical protein
MFHLEEGASRRMLNGTVLLAAADEATVLTPAQSINSIITMTPGASRAVTTPVAADIIGALDEFRIGSTFEVTIVNLAGATHPIVFTAGATGVTVTGSGTVAAATTATFKGRVASATTVIYYRS